MTTSHRALTLAALLLSLTLSAEIAVKTGDSIAFLGDSITANGNRYQGGYVNLVIDGLKANGIQAKKIPAGISGHKSNQMLARVDKDVISKKPQFMTLSCGVNDVWHKNGVALEDYKKNITAIVEKAQGAGITVCILTATMIREDPKNENNLKLDSYNEFLRQLAAEKKCMLADANAQMKNRLEELKKTNPGTKGPLLTYDGVHMNALGDEIMAAEVLKALGLNDNQLKTAQDAWRKNAKPVTIGLIQFGAADVEKLIKLAAQKKMSLQEYIGFLVKSALAE